MIKSIGAVLLICGMAAAQEANPTSQPRDNSNAQADVSGSVPIYRIAVVDRTIKAINYRHRSGSTKIDFAGTTLEPNARGSAVVDSRRGRLVIDAKFDHLLPASSFGPEYLTYVLWAITPEGRPQNLGEVLLDGSKSAINVTTDLQAFGLIVTAEPYYAVTQPSDAVVLENNVRPETVGTIEQVDAKYQLLPRGQYVQNFNRANLKIAKSDHKVPLELEEARNAVDLAEVAQADQYAAESIQKAKTELQNAEGFQHSHSGSKQVIASAREAVQDAEDARIISLRKQRDEAVAKERAAAAEREAEANAKAQQEAQGRTQAEAERAAAEQQKEQAEQAKAQAEQAKAEADAAAQKAQQEKADAEAARQAALQQQQALQAQTQQAQQQAQLASQRAQQAEAEKVQMRERLRQQLNSILATRETAQGLIVNMSDVLFDTGKYTLKPSAREKLAKVAGIVLAYPDLKLKIDGYTDNVGGDEYNQHLSEQRAMAVRDYLISQGINMNSVAAEGLGKSNPIASNTTAQGRQQNRRVELVVSGESINAGLTGNPAGTSTGESTYTQNGTAATQNGANSGTMTPTGGTSPAAQTSTPAAPTNTGNGQSGIANPAGSSAQPDTTTPSAPR
ncbi:MAG TPA: OmpA family protein [Terriglobales bacterium]